jgi:hypothetical protein
LALDRAFYTHGPIVSATVLYDWCRRWSRCHDYGPISQCERWSIVRVLCQVAEPAGRATTRGRPVLWRLRNNGP